MPIGKKEKVMTKSFYNLPVKKNAEGKVEVTPEQVGEFIGVYLLGPVLFMVCWNYTLPYILGVKGINYLHAFCLIVMIRFLKNDKS